jgi:hypothetical protein
MKQPAGLRAKRRSRAGSLLTLAAQLQAEKHPVYPGKRASGRFGCASSIGDYSYTSCACPLKWSHALVYSNILWFLREGNCGVKKTVAHDTFGVYLVSIFGGHQIDCMRMDRPNRKCIIPNNINVFIVFYVITTTWLSVREGNPCLPATSTSATWTEKQTVAF